jgi:DNA invertase Pin-like site-specific DNA recombinase
MALIGYARVSTLEQEATLQLDALEAAKFERTYTDRASGALADRPELARALEHLREGDTLVVWRLDRLGRSLRHLVETVGALEERGVGFRSLTESIDTTTPGGRLVFHVFAALAKFERDLIRERTHAGLTAARARGRRGGRRPVMSAEKLAVAQAMYDSREHTTAKIAEVLGVSRATLYRHLGDERSAC